MDVNERGAASCKCFRTSDVKKGNDCGMVKSCESNNQQQLQTALTQTTYIPHLDGRCSDMLRLDGFMACFSAALLISKPGFQAPGVPSPDRLLAPAIRPRELFCVMSFHRVVGRAGGIARYPEYLHPLRDRPGCGILRSLGAREVETGTVALRSSNLLGLLVRSPLGLKV